MAQDALYVYPKQSADSLQIAFRILGKIAYEKESIKIDHRTGLLLFSAPYDNIQHMAFADHQPVFEQIYDTICAGEALTWNGNTYTKPGTYTDTLQNIYGCDSIVTLHLHVLPDPPITFTVNGVSFKMIRVRAGTFMMGATPEQGTDALPDEKPAHQVTLTRDYFIGETVLTQELWTAVMGTTIQEEEAKGSVGSLNNCYDDNYPMYCISYNDCLRFINTLNTITGLTFRMPTEAEWEYAARGGHLSRGYKYPGSNNPDEVAWTTSNAPDKKLRKVKLLKPNELGLYDMGGNVWEMVLDDYRDYTDQAVVDPMGDTTGLYIGYRGGSTAWGTSLCRVSCRQPSNYERVEKSTKGSYRRAFRFVLDADRVIGEDNTTYQAFDTICAGETYSWNGNTYTKPGSYTDTLQNIYGCDSIVTLHLEVLPDPPITFTVNGVSFNMMRVRAGTFMMGATADDVGAEADEFPRHEVTLTKDYFIAETEMTQALWQAIMGNNPSEDKSNPLSPVNNVSWDDCQEMIAKLNELTGLTFRLPTEAEWEYAARAGYYSRGYIYAGSNDIDEVACYNQPYYASVASLKPNEIGVYDMSGSVYEWCQDWYNSNFYQSPDHHIDPFQAESVDGRRCVRGGCNMQDYGADTKKYSRIANRGYQITKESHVGLRLALEATGIMENNREFVTYDTICAGESYTWDANKKIYTKPGSYTDTLQNIYGCDSIVTLHLEVLPDPPLSFTVNGVSFKMMRVRAGTFMMGASDDDIKAETNERPAHQVTLTRDYFIAETMLTQELWTAVMGTTIQEEEAKGSGDKGLGYGPNYPMYCISYYDCQNFVKSLSDSIGLEFRMPTEAEWEYAARGGHLSRGYKYPGSNNATEVAWNVTNDPSQKLHEVKQLLPNELGLYDMAGNTWEWVFDYNRFYTSEAQVNPIGDSLSTKAFVRGGSSYYSSHYNRVSCRGMQYSKTFKANRIAFRFVLDADRVIGEDNTTYQAYDTICSGETYSWNGNTYTKPGSYTDTLQNIYGCDSIVTLHLQVHPTYEVHDTVVACDSYLFNPFNKNGGGYNHLAIRNLQRYCGKR